MRHKYSGFTLIELMLSMTFLSILLVMIALLTIQVSNIYTKGVTLKAVNQAGVELSDDLKRTLNQSSPDQVREVVDMSGKGGRLCTGTYSYAWNYGQTINDSVDGAAGANEYSTAPNDNAKKDIRFVKVVDPGSQLCSPQEGGLYPPIDTSKSTELLAKGNRNLVIHGLQISRSDLAGDQTIFTIHMVLGTNNQDEFISGQTQCRPPSDGFDEFCAVNTLDFTARASNSDIGSQL